eukprot:CAMPEP_0118873072 /NCGR_PEP_ID=MMETSP1163-20130328/15022_1 /TAXON_ID=124430 /ORGANISM="Phaeomonas parva, Strain CCMP2877" /LENGTH=776 /DNA_ID=CAMNT_0006808325 /DNA_START=219 /DNA_END=2549 /DNA_ORIENTATION=+
MAPTPGDSASEEARAAAPVHDDDETKECKESLDVEPHSPAPVEAPAVGEPLPKTALPRGGYAVETSVGPIQVGMPPETIKDSMSLGLPIPRHFVLPSERFVKALGPDMGINVAEFEFPAYCNFFFHRRTVNLIVKDAETEASIRAVLQETLFGPAELDIRQDYDDSVPDADLPNLGAELAFFRKFGDKRIEIDMLVSFTHFEENNVARIEDNGKVVEVHRDGDEFKIIDGARSVSVPDAIVGSALTEQQRSTEPFQPPLFGVTVLGNSHGFDPVGRTTGYIVWINKRGIMIDPPPSSHEVLEAYMISPKLITGIIVTHCHADHDAGTFQRILQENKVTLYTTATIHGSFLRKYSALSGLNADLLQESYQFKAMTLGRPLNIRGAMFKCFYSLHSIPCLAFEIAFQGKRMVFSADHMNDVENINSLHAEGVLTDARREQLLAFPWDCDVIFHEAGVPPIHTPMATLVNLPDDVKERLYVVHVGAKSIPEGSGLKPAPVGVENTINIVTNLSEFSRALEIMEILGSVDIFESLSVGHARDLLNFVKDITFQQGQPVMVKGEPGNDMMIIMSGLAEVIIRKAGGEIEFTKTFSMGDYFGEQALMQPKSMRSADIVAKTKLEVLRIERTDFMWLLRGTPVMDRIKQTVLAREAHTWTLIDLNTTLKFLTASQRTHFERCVTNTDVEQGDILWSAGSEHSAAVLVDTAEVEYEGPARQDTPFTRGTWVCEVDNCVHGRPAENALKVTKSGRVLLLSQSNVIHLLMRNPGLYLALLNRLWAE